MCVYIYRGKLFNLISIKSVGSTFDCASFSAEPPKYKIANLWPKNIRRLYKNFNACPRHANGRVQGCVGVAVCILPTLARN